MILELIISALGFLKTWKTGNKWTYAPLIGIISQIFWVIIIIRDAQWGLLPGCVMYTFLYNRNFIKWRKDATHENHNRN